MNELQVFTNNDFGEIRVIEENGNVLFCGSDVARALGYQNPSRDVKRHCKSPVARCTTDSVGRQQEMLFIPEADLYRLAFRSNLPSAERLTDWVAEEVLPAIRKTGTYQAKPLTTAQMFQLQAQINVEQEQRLAALEERAGHIQAAFETMALPTVGKDQWQEETNRAVRQLCERYGLNYQKTIGDMYKELEELAGVNLSVRQKRLQERMKRGGAKYAECRAVSKLMVISQDKKLREIYSGIVRRHSARCAALESAAI